MHLLQVYSNPAPGVATPQVMLFRSRTREHQDATREARRRARQLRADEANAVAERYLVVRNVRAVAAEFHLSRTTVSRILASQGIDTSRGMKPAEVKHAMRLYAEGLSSITIGQQLGFDNHTILKELRRAGVQVRARSGGPSKT